MKFIRNPGGCLPDLVVDLFVALPDDLSGMYI